MAAPFAVDIDVASDFRLQIAKPPPLGRGPGLGRRCSSSIPVRDGRKPKRRLADAALKTASSLGQPVIAPLIATCAPFPHRAPLVVFDRGCLPNAGLPAEIGGLPPPPRPPLHLPAVRAGVGLKRQSGPGRARANPSGAGQQGEGAVARPTLPRVPPRQPSPPLLPP